VGAINLTVCYFLILYGRS